MWGAEHVEEREESRALNNHGCGLVQVWLVLCYLLVGLFLVDIYSAPRACNNLARACASCVRLILSLWADWRQEPTEFCVAKKILHTALV